MAFVLGLNCVTHYNTGTFGSPTWVAVSNVAKMKVTLKRDKSEASRRASAFKQFAGTLGELGASWEMLWNLADTAFAALLASAYGNTEQDMTFLDGATGSGAHQGPRISAGFETFDQAQGEDEIDRVSVAVFPGITNIPTWFTGTS